MMDAGKSINFKHTPRPKKTYTKFKALLIWVGAWRYVYIFYEVANPNSSHAFFFFIDGVMHNI